MSCSGVARKLPFIALSEVTIWFKYVINQVSLHMMKGLSSVIYKKKSWLCDAPCLYFSTNICTLKFGSLISVNGIRTSMQITVYKPKLLVFVLTLYFHLCYVIRIVGFVYLYCRLNTFRPLLSLCNCSYDANTRTHITACPLTQLKHSVFPSDLPYISCCSLSSWLTRKNVSFRPVKDNDGIASLIWFGKGVDGEGLDHTR
jgi:hypothetical protein